MKIAIDLFCGSGSFGKVCRSLDIECISVDVRRRVGTCEPTLKLDICKVPGTFFKSLNPLILWAGLPCDIWSNASGGFHLDKKYQALTAKAVKHMEIYQKTMEIIESKSAAYFVIENPRGKLDRYDDFKKRLEVLGGKIHYCTLSSYGFPTTKPTMIATNIPDLILKPMDAFGRGAKNVSGRFDNMTKVQRQSTPQLLIKSILQQALQHSVGR